MANRTVTVEVSTRDASWITRYTAGHREGRVQVPGCQEVDRRTFMGREWVNYNLPDGVPTPADWAIDLAGQSGILSAPAEWVS